MPIDEIRKLIPNGIFKILGSNIVVFPHSKSGGKKKKTKYKKKYRNKSKK